MQPTVLEEMKSIKKEERKKSYVIALLYYYKILLSHVGRTQQFNHYHKPSVIQTANNNIGITAANVDIYDSVVVFCGFFCFILENTGTPLDVRPQTRHRRNQRSL